MLRQAKRFLRAEWAAAPVLPIVPGWETAAGHLSALLCLQCNKNVPVRNKCAIQKLRKSFIFFVQFCHFEAGLSVNQPKFSCRLFFVQFAPLKFLENVYNIGL